MIIPSLRLTIERVRNWIRPNIARFIELGTPKLWFLSLIIGAAVGVAAIIFREAIGLAQYWWLNNRSEDILTSAKNVSWYWVLAAPIVGGFIVGILLNTLKAKRTGSVADVIESRAVSGRELTLKDGLLSALTSAISLGSGASAGREGPIVHLGATLATVFTRNRNMPEWSARTLLASGVASAISASFNAPIAGVLFAHEVILQHYSTRSFVPIVIASAVGSVVSQLWFGDNATFIVPNYQITSYWEFPAFAFLGIVAGLVAVIFQFSLFSANFVARNIDIPLWFRPVLGGIIIGLIALVFPEILGVGYEVTDLVLWNQLPLGLLLILIVVKTAATAITLASRFGGGIFSPAMFLGAMTGGAFGLIAGQVFPSMASSEGLYAILGMGAVAGAVLGAPISTTLIVFELTGGYALSIALLLCVAIAHGVNQSIHGHSYFHWQLEMRGLFDHEGPHRMLMRTKKVMDFMDVHQQQPDAEMLQLKEGQERLLPTDTLGTALRLFDAKGIPTLPVVDASDQKTIIAQATQSKALAYFNKALIEASEEEHR